MVCPWAALCPWAARLLCPWAALGKVLCPWDGSCWWPVAECGEAKIRIIRGLLRMTQLALQHEDRRCQ